MDARDVALGQQCVSTTPPLGFFRPRRVSCLHIAACRPVCERCWETPVASCAMLGVQARGNSILPGDNPHCTGSMGSRTFPHSSASVSTIPALCSNTAAIADTASCAYRTTDGAGRYVTASCVHPTRASVNWNVLVAPSVRSRTCRTHLIDDQHAARHEHIRRDDEPHPAGARLIRTDIRQ
jgi:hypothetical protein